MYQKNNFGIGKLKSNRSKNYKTIMENIKNKTKFDSTIPI